MAARPRSRGSRAGLALVVAVVLLVALVVVADRVTVGIAERRVAGRLQTELGTAGVPQVDIEGFPFLTQVARRSLRTVHVVADDVTSPDQPGTTLEHVDLRLSDVSSPDGYQSVTASRVAGTSTLSYATAKTLTGLPLAYSPEGRVEATVQSQLMSIPVTVKVVGRPTVNQADQTLTLADPEVSVAGVDVPDSTAEALLGSTMKPARLTGIPYGLTVTGVTARPEGLVADVTGENVDFRR